MKRFAAGDAQREEAVLLTYLIFGGIAFAPPYFLLKKQSSVVRMLLAYVLGFIVAVVATIGAFALSELYVGQGAGGRTLGLGLWCALLGPIIGIYCARRSRAKRGQLEEPRV